MRGGSVYTLRTRLYVFGLFVLFFFGFMGIGILVLIIWAFG